ncbi:BLUF domain-containing protein [Paracoccus jeotgali]|uniref:BLUF domain-containing protein n=1 Tax=Paracoccus jeotgali TaxID=2065379 RepID=A0A2K9MER0_9RHOB|nr:BLUF domain-containing protein [Paracoccus jeotgali]AUM74131.1 hypothetical protein CYR75_07480 [Paracoccus jeotgali]
MQLAHLFYRSSGRLDAFDRDCDDILSVARQRNGEAGLTGFLHAEDGMFLQWIEGAPELLDPVIASILADTRHRDITILGQGPVAARKFPSWSMGFSQGRTAPLFEWLAKDDANSRDVTAYAQSLQRFLLARAA